MPTGLPPRLGRTLPPWKPPPPIERPGAMPGLSNVSTRTPMRRAFPHVFSSIRPSSCTFGLPGNGKTRAHAGKPSSRQQSHQKLATLDPVVAQKELLSAHPAPKARALAAQLNRAEATTPPAPRHPIARLAKALARGVGKLTGFHAGKPQ
ncbi:MAG TPA: hypothetical protein VFL86_18510, partial [Burkholderiaceae bacterium]|nr:hypothetical protein [Burkholderiaceae bacterium]